MLNKPKYKVGQRVMIDKIFSTEKNVQGSMEKLEEIRIAVVVHVEARSSLGPCYKIKWVDPKLKESRIRYWETDILGPEQINKIKQET